MITILYIVLGLTVLVVLVSTVWRFSSRRRSLPCPTWLAWMVEMDNPFTKTNRAHVIIEHLDLKPGMKVLDAGCGPGRLTIPIAQKIGPQGMVIAMDIQPGMLQRVQKKALATNIQNIQFLNAGLGDGKLEQNHYDRALLVCVLGEIPDQAAALKEIFDSLKPGGILSVTEIIFDPHFQRSASVFQLASGIGFQKKNIFGNRLAYTMHLEKPL